MARLRLAGLMASIALLATSAPAVADPAPFGHPCSPQQGVRFCPTASDSDRVPSFDGVPLDVDVTLPAEGDGPFPALVMLHSLAGDKRMLEAATPDGTRSLGGLLVAGAATLEHYNNLYFASRGLAVVNVSLRGWGRSCGRPDSRTSGCERGWIHWLDQRFEARDVQYLLGLLVDQGIAKPDALGVTGISMGGGLTVRLAFLNDRVRLPDGSFSAWTSRAGVPLRLAAAYARWGTGSAVTSIMPNGRPFGAGAADPGTVPLGIEKESGVAFLTGLMSATGFVPPPGMDPSASFPAWAATFAHGEPYGPAAAATVNELNEYHGAFSALGAATPPLLLEAGYSDDLTGTLEVVRVYRRITSAHSGPVLLQLGDTGHFRATNAVATVRSLNLAGESFLERTLLGSGPAPPTGSVTALPETCPGTGSLSAVGAPTLDALARRTLRFTGARRPVTIDSRRGSARVAAAVTPRLGGSTACSTVSADRPRGGVATYQWRLSRPEALAGTPLVTATIAAHGAVGQLALRLWDLDRAGMERLVTRAAYRVTRGERGRIRVSVGLNYYRFARGHTIKLEILGRDPGYLRPSTGRFTVAVSRVALRLPVR